MTLSIYIAITINKNILQYYLVLEKMPRTEARGIVFYINPSRIQKTIFYVGTQEHPDHLSRSSWAGLAGAAY